jgi:transposase-like protein
MSELQCPKCHVDTLYRYGKTRAGKQRYLCLACGRQFTPDSGRIEPHERPLCIACGKPMHVYKREKGFTRFRCSDYPKCKTFLKMIIKEMP